MSGLPIDASSNGDLLGPALGALRALGAGPEQAPQAAACLGLVTRLLGQAGCRPRGDALGGMVEELAAFAGRQESEVRLPPASGPWRPPPGLLGDVKCL